MPSHDASIQNPGIHAPHIDSVSARLKTELKLTPQSREVSAKNSNMTKGTVFTHTQALERPLRSMTKGGVGAPHKQLAARVGARHFTLE